MVFALPFHRVHTNDIRWQQTCFRFMPCAPGKLRGRGQQQDRRGNAAPATLAIYGPMLKTTVERGGSRPWRTSPAEAFQKNLPRVCARVQAEIELGSWPVPPIFSFVAGLGKWSAIETAAPVNMGVGI